MYNLSSVINVFYSDINSKDLILKFHELNNFHNIKLLFHIKICRSLKSLSLFIQEETN